jgi:phospholipid/cholesterol/gamma-HCH transport system ATP-binding protein
VINVINVHQSFKGVRALNGLSLVVADGVMMGLMGPGGGGKSTICGLLKPDSGAVVVDRVDMIKATPDRVRKVQARLGVQFQNDALFEHMTVLENVAYPLRRLTDLGEQAVEYEARERLAMVGLGGLEERLPNRLSGGQRRRVAIARACVANPRLLICDDPTAGLDPVTSRQILDMINGIHYQARNTVVIASSDVLGLLSVVDRAAMVWEGKVIAEGTPGIIWHDRRRQVRRFLDDAKLPDTVRAPSGVVRWDW